ncbi:MAG: cytidylate kinase [Candidatus Omnitrophota bacterium]|jgi:cytidylate kinase
MTNKILVAIDGPAGSGKSTVAKQLAEKLQIPYLDTGAMYRAVTYVAVTTNVELTNESAIAELSKIIKIDFKKNEKGLEQVIANGIDVTHEIRTPELTNQVHHIASNSGVRENMVAMQRVLGKKYGGVVEGRDIGTVVFPDTPYKFYLDGDISIRVERRAAELNARGVSVKIEDLTTEQERRDARDKNRKISPLKQADDAILVDTSKLTISEVVGTIAQLISDIMGSNNGTKSPIGRKK